MLMPQYKKVADNFSIPWIYHSDGMLYDVLDDLVTLGMNAIHPVEPLAMVIKLLKEKYGSHIVILRMLRP